MRAPRRHPATKALADIRGWKARWAIGQTTADTEAILAVESWLRRVAKEPAKRAAKAPSAAVVAALTATPRHRPGSIEPAPDAEAWTKLRTARKTAKARTGTFDPDQFTADAIACRDRPLTPPQPAQVPAKAAARASARKPAKATPGAGQWTGPAADGGGQGPD